MKNSSVLWARTLLKGHVEVIGDWKVDWLWFQQSQCNASIDYILYTFYTSAIRYKCTLCHLCVSSKFTSSISSSNVSTTWQLSFPTSSIWISLLSLCLCLLPFVWKAWAHLTLSLLFKFCSSPERLEYPDLPEEKRLVDGTTSGGWGSWYLFPATRVRPWINTSFCFRWSQIFPPSVVLMFHVFECWI